MLVLAALEVRGRELVATALKKERGATMVEYGLLIAFIAIVLILALIFLAGGVGSIFSKAGSCVAS
jgi:pilus assembly protein Flp/PilA